MLHHNRRHVELRESLSSWRAWIEIYLPRVGLYVRSGRSPHGERGLKSDLGFRGDDLVRVALLMESVD